MPRRRLSLALLLVAALAAMALSAAVGAATEPSPPLTKGGDPAFDIQAGRLDASMGRLTGEDRRDPTASQRGSKQRLVLFAIVTALLVLPVLGQRRASLLAESRRPAVSWWSPRFGRAPPSFQLLIV